MIYSSLDVRHRIFLEVADSGYRLSSSSSNYRLLYVLAMSSGLTMNGSPSRIARLCHVTPRFIQRQASSVLRSYVETGVLTIPPEFQLKGR